METSKMETTDIRQVEEMLLAKLADITEEKDRIWLVTLVKCYYALLKMTQELPILHRLKYFDCTYIVFSFLHLNGQLRRHKERFDEEYVNDLNQMFKRLYDRL
jgi:hypothetical protein